jgi:hypothetical protein
MLFVYGTYEHVSGFRVKIDSTGVYVSPDAPLSMRISEFLNPKNWKIIDEDYDEKGEK